MTILELIFTKMTPTIVFVLMLMMGLSLTVDDFKRIIAYPKAVLIGISGQIIFLPALAFVLATILGASPAIAAGCILLAACPGGVTSNGYVFISRGDVGLSVTLTAFSSVITVVTIPLIASATMQHFFANSVEPFNLPILPVVRQLVFLMAVPLAIGMSIIHRWPVYRDRALVVARRVSFVLLVTIIVVVTAGTLDVLREHLLEVAALAASLNVVSLAAGYLFGRLGRLPTIQVRTLTFEVGVQNIAVATLVAMSILGRPELATFAIVYAMFMKATSLGLIYLWRQKADTGAT